MKGRIALAALAGLANANFLLAPLVGARIDLTTGVISELSVPGEPGSVWFRLGDGSAGLLCALLAVPLWRSGLRHARFRGSCLTAFGLTTLVSAIVPLTCAPSLGVCPASSAGPELLHDGVSVIGTLGAVLGVLELAWRARGWALKPLAVLSAAVSGGAGVYEVVTFLQGGNGGGGDSQRYQVLAVSAWVLLEVVSQWRERGTSREAQVPSPV
ncbi:DUF998 domain-containing protein [Kineococcus sp. GCM10028916]|uniref:DUF998 domain-containing protein n=1 Tax=Kineococcus sp. GCM10028916 TaxID=3273394 RepID=UPI003638DF8A